MEEKDGLDVLLEPLGGFGKFQKLVIFYVSIIAMFCAISELSYAMTAGSLKHRCLISEKESANSSYDQPWLPDLIPKASSEEYESCLRFNSSDINHENTYKCDKFIYDTEEWTINREDWDIHCTDDRWKLTLLGSLNNAGQFAGGFYVGYLSDRFGRKRAIVSLAVVTSILGVIKSFSVNFPMMATIEFIEANFAVALFSGPFVLALEIVKPSRRVLAGAIVSITYPLGEALLAGVQWATMDWRTSLRILYAPFILQVFLFWLMPESVRWLINNKKDDEALIVLRRIARLNGKPFTENTENMMRVVQISQEKSDGRNKKAALSSLAKSPIMRMRFIACYFLWIANVFIYFGMTLNSVSVNDNKFLNFILTALVEIPSVIVTTLIVDRIGRRLCQSSSFILCGVACLLFAFVPDDDSWGWVKLVLFLVGKFGSAASYLVISVFTTEMFPTSIRSSVMSWMLTGGKLASILAPQTPLLADIYKPLPLLVFSALAGMAGFLTLIFPETLNTKLPDTIEEAEKLGMKNLEKDSNNIQK